MDINLNEYDIKPNHHVMVNILDDKVTIQGVNSLTYTEDFIEERPILNKSNHFRVLAERVEFKNNVCVNDYSGYIFILNTYMCMIKGIHFDRHIKNKLQANFNDTKMMSLKLKPNTYIQKINLKKCEIDKIECKYIETLIGNESTVKQSMGYIKDVQGNCNIKRHSMIMNEYLAFENTYEHVKYLDKSIINFFLMELI